MHLPGRGEAGVKKGGVRKKSELRTSTSRRGLLTQHRSDDIFQSYQLLFFVITPNF